MSNCKTQNGKRECITCKSIKPVSEFSSYKYITRQGKESCRYDSRCKECNRVRRKLRYNDPVNGAMDRATSQNWKIKNQDRLTDYRSLRQANPEHRANKAKAQRKRKARIRASTDHSDSRIDQIYRDAMDLEKKLNACVVCDDPLELKIHVDHVIPLAVGGLHVAENLQLLSARENLKKGANPHFAIVNEADRNG